VGVAAWTDGEDRFVGVALGGKRENATTINDA
jgi:hypothetical protein